MTLPYRFDGVYTVFDSDFRAVCSLSKHVDPAKLGPLLARALNEADATEIDEAWLRSVGFEMSRDGFPFHPDIEGYFKPSPKHIAGEQVMWDWKLLPPADHLLMGVFASRGDLRTLCRALGVPLAEQENSNG